MYFDSVREKLQAAEVELWDKQLTVVNKIHRSPDGLEVNLYCIRNGKSDFPKEICFANNSELKVATFDVKSNGSKRILRGSVWCVNGHVFSIEYKTSFKYFENIAKGELLFFCHIENYPGNNHLKD